MKRDTLAGVGQENLTLHTPSSPATQKPGRKIFLLWLLLLSSVAFITSAVLENQLDGPTGDEPHYLVISQTLLLYHSLDVMQDYTHADYKSFYPSTLGPIQQTSTNKWGTVLPLHSIGAPILWLLPFAIAGRLGTLLFMALVSVLIIINVYLLILSLGIQRNYAFFICVGLTLASPVLIYAGHNFVEPIAALLCIYVLRVLFQERLQTLDLAGSSLALGLLPWLHIRFALFEIVLCCFLVAAVYQENRFTKLKPYLAALLPLCALFLLFEAYNFFIWGSLNPAINQASSGEVPFDNAPERGLFGLFFDQEYGLLTNFPIYLFLLGGILLALKRKLLRFNVLMLFLVLPYLITIASFHNWDGAISPPTRLLTVLVPALAFYLALALQKARSWITNGLFLLFTSVAFLYYIVSWRLPGGWMNFQDSHNRSLLFIGKKLHLPLTSGIPSFFTNGKPTFPWPKQAFSFLGWILFLGVLTLLVLLLARRQKKMAA